MNERTAIEALDAADPLRRLRDEFVIDDDAVYLDGNSLGRLPRVTAARVARAVEDEWGRELVGGWDHWIDLPGAVGDDLGRHFLGAATGQVLVADSTTVNLYKLAAAALDANPDRTTVVTDEDNFPTDRYVLAGLAQQRGVDLRLISTDPVHGADVDALQAAVDDTTALVCLSLVAFKSAALADMRAVNDIAHAYGALTLWDLSHAAGAVPIALDVDDADLAVGCTYKYLNAGPGAPAYLYVRREHRELRSPIWGWFAQRDQFAMGPVHEPVDGIGRFATGTPPVPGLIAVREGVRLLASAGIGPLREKSVALTDLLIERVDERLTGLGFAVATPRDPARRGGHVALAHPEASLIGPAVRTSARVVADVRPPDRLRLGPAAAYTRFVDVWDAIERIHDLVASGQHLGGAGPGRIP